MVEKWQFLKLKFSAFFSSKIEKHSCQKTLGFRHNKYLKMTVLVSFVKNIYVVAEKRPQMVKKWPF
jgi:hypothetical protein